MRRSHQGMEINEVVMEDSGFFPGKLLFTTPLSLPPSLSLPLGRLEKKVPGKA